VKRIALLALAGSAIAQVPAPVAAPVPAPVPTEAPVVNVAPLAPIHDILIQGNPAVGGSFASVVVTPHDYFGKRAATFQWNGGTPDFQGNAIAVCDKVFAAFDVTQGSGNLTGGYMTPVWGAGARVALNRYGASTSDSLAQITPVEVDSSLAPTGFGIFGSMALAGKKEAYARLDWFTPSNYSSLKLDTYTPLGKVTTENSSRADGIHLGAGVRTEAKGPRGYSWNVALDYANVSSRNSGQSSDSTHAIHTFHELGQLGKTVEADGNILAMGVDQRFIVANGRGGAADTSYIVYNGAYVAPDWRYWVTIEPTLAVIIPIFENWTLKGGARTGLVYTSWDAVTGEKAYSEGRLTTTAPTGSLGVRYARNGRWAAEALVNNAFLSYGPYFVSGEQTSPLMAAFAITVALR